MSLQYCTSDAGVPYTLVRPNNTPALQNPAVRYTGDMPPVLDNQFWLGTQFDQKAWQIAKSFLNVTAALPKWPQAFLNKPIPEATRGRACRTTAEGTIIPFDFEDSLLPVITPKPCCGSDAAISYSELMGYPGVSTPPSLTVVQANAWPACPIGNGPGYEISGFEPSALTNPAAIMAAMPPLPTTLKTDGPYQQMFASSAVSQACPVLHQQSSSSSSWLDAWKSDC